MKKLVLPVLILATINASAQKVSNKLGLKPGQTIQVVSDVSITSEMPMAGESKNSTKTTELYAVKSVAGNDAVVEHSTKNIKLNISIMGRDMALDSDKPEDLNGQQGELLKTLTSQKQEFTIDANGVVTKIATQEKKKEGEDMMAMMMQQMNTSSPIKVGGSSPLTVLPAYAVGVGDSWTDSTGDAKNKTQTTYTVKSISGGSVMVDYITNGTIDTKQEMMGMSADMKGKVKGTGTITVDAATGLPKQKINNSTTEMAMSIAGQDMNITSKTAATSVYTVQ